MKQRDRLMLLGVLAAVVLVAGWFLALAPRREQAADLGEQVATQRAARDSALQDVAAGVAAKREFGRYYATVARLGAAVPDDDNVPSLLLQVQRAAEASKIDFRSLKVGQSSGAATPAPAPPTDPAAPATQAATATLPPGAAVGTAGFPTMPFSFEFDGDFFHLSDFVGRLERFLVVHNRRLAVEWPLHDDRRHLAAGCPARLPPHQGQRRGDDVPAACERGTHRRSICGRTR